MEKSEVASLQRSSTSSHIPGHRRVPPENQEGLQSRDTVLPTVGPAVLFHHESGLGGSSHPTPGPQTPCLTGQALLFVFNVLASLVSAREVGMLVCFC